MTKPPSTIDNQDGLMTVREVAILLRLSEKTIYKWTKSGKIPAMKIGYVWRFERQVVDEWMRNNPAKERNAK